MQPEIRIQLLEEANIKLRAKVSVLTKENKRLHIELDISREYHYNSKDNEEKRRKDLEDLKDPSTKYLEKYPWVKNL